MGCRSGGVWEADDSTESSDWFAGAGDNVAVSRGPVGVSVVSNLSLVGWKIKEMIS